jgi:3-dehydroquinate synthase
LCFSLLKTQGTVQLISYPAGESIKSMERIQSIWEHLLHAGSTAADVLVCLGGGTVCDAGGFAAATYKRGMACYFMPTTLTAQIDAAHGGKNGVNLHSIRNALGVIAFPEHIYIDPVFLRTLPAHELLHGWAECCKHGLLASGELWEKLMHYDVQALAQLTQEQLSEILKVKVDIVTQDPFEAGVRRTLNFGHTCAHAWEAVGLLTGTPVAHGIAVGWGMQVALKLSEIYAGCPKEFITSALQYLKKTFGVPPGHLTMHPHFINALMQDKKNVATSIRFVLLKNVGEAVWNVPVEVEDILHSIHHVCHE